MYIISIPAIVLSADLKEGGGKFIFKYCKEILPINSKNMVKC